MSSGGGGGSEHCPAIARAAEAADELYRVRDTYFPSDQKEKEAKLQTLADAALALLDSVPSEERKSPSQRAVYEFLRGKILDAFPDYRKEAEVHLSKAVKLNPSLADAWLYLGMCFWKKGDLPSAKNCFSLALSKGPNKKILCQLSMLERKMSQGTENQSQLIEDSICHAKEAVTLDIKDGNSWYNLGNAYLISFFYMGSWDHTKLQQSLKAYQNAEKDEMMTSNPDLYFNYATANRYLENYERALQGFEAASSMDPGLNADREFEKFTNLLDKLEISIKGQARAKRLISVASSLGEVNLKSTHKKATMNILVEGRNKSVAVVAKLLLFINDENKAPLYFLACDQDQTLFVLSVYGLLDDAIKEGDRITLLEPYHRMIDFSWKGKIKEGDRITLLEPYHRMIDFSWKGKRYQFKSIRVDFVEQILVNEKTPSPQHAARASIRAQHKPS